MHRNGGQSEGQNMQFRNLFRFHIACVYLTPKFDVTGFLPIQRRRLELLREPPPFAEGPFLTFPKLARMRFSHGNSIEIEILGFWTVGYLLAKFSEIDRTGIEKLHVHALLRSGDIGTAAGNILESLHSVHFPRQLRISELMDAVGIIYRDFHLKNITFS